MSKRYLILLLLLVLLINFNPLEGVAMGKTPNYKTQIKEKYRKIDLSDGVDKEEAIIIAQNYMIEQGENFYKDFVISKPKVFDDSKFNEIWIVSFPTTLEFRWKTGLEWNTLYISKKSGEVEYGGEGPS